MASIALPAGTGEPNINNGPKLLASVGTVTGMAVLTVCARMWVRSVMIKSVGWDDRFMVAAMLLSFVGLMLVIPEVHYGAGRHVAYLPDTADRSYGLYLNFISQPFYLVAIVLVKVSIGLFLQRLTPATFFRRFIWGMQVFMFIYTTVALCTIVTQCRPLSVIWDPDVKNPVCFSPPVLRACAYFNAGCGIFADLVFALLPIPMLWKVRINGRVKLALVCVLSLGLFATSACIVKVWYLTSYGQYNDFLWDSVNITIWTACELNIGIVAASIPTLRPLSRAMFEGSSYTGGYLKSKENKSNNEQRFVQHITNSQGNSKARTADRTGSSSSKEEGFEMYGSVVTANGRVPLDNDSEENILPVQGAVEGIIKTTQVLVRSDEVVLGKKRSIDDRV